MRIFPQAVFDFFVDEASMMYCDLWTHYTQSDRLRQLINVYRRYDKHSSVGLALPLLSR